MRRLFFALWPDDAVRARLHAGLSGLVPALRRPSAIHNLHLTLIFLGDVAPEQQECVERCAAAAAGEGFALTLDTVGTWPRSRILWMGPSQTPPALEFLVTRLSTGLEGCGFRPERRPYRPHITLSRNASRPHPGPAIEPILWIVNDFALMESRPEDGKVRYVMLKSWSLS